MAGLILVSQGDPLGQVIDDLVLVGEITTAEEWEEKIEVLGDRRDCRGLRVPKFVDASFPNQERK
ncbi:MAG: hypothetical protein ACREQ7_13465 [Candidatus Binatia bacterium]